MDIKAALMEPKTWVTVGSVVLILILGLGPLMTGLEGGTDHPDSAHPELMESLSGEDKEAVVDIVNQNLFEFGLWNVLNAVEDENFTFLNITQISATQKNTDFFYRVLVEYLENN